MSQEIVDGLLDRRAQLAGEIEVAQLALRRKIADLDSVDAAIRVFAPSLSTQTPREKRIPPQHQALRGAVKSTVLAMLEAASGPITTEAIALQLLTDRRLPLDDPQLRKLFISRVGQSLFVMMGKGLVRRAGRVGRFRGWELER